jgi:hypothetical protein
VTRRRSRRTEATSIARVLGSHVLSVETERTDDRDNEEDATDILYTRNGQVANR